MNLTSNQTIFLIIAVICAALISYTLTPAVRVLAFRIGAVDVPLDDRRMHTKPIPRIGGLAIYVSYIICSLIFSNYNLPGLSSILIGGAMIVSIGIVDDIYRLSPWSKFVIQILAATYAIVNGCVIDHIAFGSTYLQLGLWGYPLTFFWIVGITNALNFIDGLDGLSCGVSLISSLSIVVVLLLHGELDYALITALLAGACLGFLPFNSNPAVIFMGDTGATFLGYSLAVISVQGMFKVHTVLSFIGPLVILGYPIVDTLFAIVRRLAAGKSPFAPDRGHLHHRLIDMGFTQKESVSILYAICGLLGMVAVFSTENMFDEGRVIKALCIAVVAVIILSLDFIIMRNPDMRKHSGLIQNDMTVKDYLEEIEARKQKKNKNNTETKSGENGSGVVYSGDNIDIPLYEEKEEKNSNSDNTEETENTEEAEDKVNTENEKE